jgi:hypothetical protein
MGHKFFGTVQEQELMFDGPEAKLPPEDNIDWNNIRFNGSSRAFYPEDEE